MKILSFPSQYIFLIQSLFKTDANPLWSHPPPHYINPLCSLPPPPIHMFSFNSYANLMQILSEAFSLPKYIFLVQSLFKTDGNPLGSIPPPQYIFLTQFLSKFDANPL